VSPRRGTRSLGEVLTSRSLVWVAAIVVVLVVVDAVLVAMALSRTAPEANREPGPVPTFTSTPFPSHGSSGTPTPSASAGSSDTGEPAASSRLLTAVDGKQAWRAVSGTCGGDAGTLERSVDGGATWSPVGLGVGSRTVLALRADGASVSALTGTGDNCAPSVRTSKDDGATWDTGVAGAAGAGVTPTGLVLDTGAVASPCPDPAAVYQGQYTTAVVCDGSVSWRKGTGAWVSVALSGVQSLADAGDEYTVARTGVAGCEGVRIDSMRATGVTASTTTSRLGCADDAAADGVVVARAGQSVWLWSGDVVRVSADGGATW